MDRILIIEDDRTMNEGIAMTLEGTETKIFSAENLKEGKAILEKEEVDLLLLDVNLPDGNGFEFCRELRKTSELPVIFLTANDMELDIVRGLELGGDDYITKPFSLMVLRARVRTVLRRRKGETRSSEIYCSGGLQMDFQKMEVSRAGAPVRLSRTEYNLLRILVANRGRTLSKELLMDRIWGTEYVEDHVLPVTIKRLRDKLQTDKIRSIYGVGYMWKKEEEADGSK